MNIIALIFILVALILFGIAALNVPARFNLVAAGLFFWVLSTLWPMLAKGF